MNTLKALLIELVCSSVYLVPVPAPCPIHHGWKLLGQVRASYWVWNQEVLIYAGG